MKGLCMVAVCSFCSLCFLLNSVELVLPLSRMFVCVFFLFGGPLPWAAPLLWPPPWAVALPRGDWQLRPYKVIYGD